MTVVTKLIYYLLVMTLIKIYTLPSQSLKKKMNPPETI